MLLSRITELKNTDFKETEYNNNNNVKPSGGSCDDSMASIYDLYKTGINPTLPNYIKNKLKENEEKYGKPLVEYALEQAIYSGKAYNYALGVLKNLESQNIKTVAEAEKARNKKKSTIGSHQNMNVQSREMTPQWILDKSYENKNTSEKETTEEEDLELEKDREEFLKQLRSF